tara:strand:- start:4027 stop:4275 length:249 start_codon:yes stop_codon:yes gene_type:complete
MEYEKWKSLLKYMQKFHFFSEIKRFTETNGLSGYYLRCDIGEKMIYVEFGLGVDQFNQQLTKTLFHKLVESEKQILQLNIGF